MSRNTNFDGAISTQRTLNTSNTGDRNYNSVASRNIARNRRLHRGLDSENNNIQDSTNIESGSGSTTATQPVFTLTQGSNQPQDYLQTFINASMVSETQSNRIVLFSRDNGGMLKNSTVRIDATGNVKGIRDIEVSGTMTINGNCIVPRGGSLKITDDPVDDNDVATKAYVDAAFDRQRDLAFSNNFTNLSTPSGIYTPKSTSVPSVDPMLADLMKSFTPSMDSSKLLGDEPTDSTNTEFYNSIMMNETSIGLNPKQAVSLATTEPLPESEMKTIGSNGIGDLLVSIRPGKICPIDSTSPTVGDRILIKNEVKQERNGIYYIQDVGSDHSCWTLVRTSDYDQPREIPLAYFFVKNGEHNKNTTWVNMNKTKVTIGITPIVFTQFSNVGEVKIGRGLAKDGNEIRVYTDTDSLSIGKTGKLQISSMYPGQNSISVVGRIQSGIWNADPIDPKHGGTGHLGLPKNKILISNGDQPLNFKSLPLGEIVGTTEPQILHQKIFVDETTAIQDQSSTKRIQFSLSEISPGVNRVLNLPDCNTTLLGTNNIAVITNKIIDQSNHVCASYFRNCGSAIQLQDKEKPVDGQILTLVSSNDSDTGVIACWKTPESSLNFENIGAAGVGVYKQKINGSVLLKKLHTPSGKLKIVDAYNSERVDFDIHEQGLKLNEVGGNEILSVAKGGTGLSSFPNRKVCVGAIGTLDMTLQAPITDFVGINDTQTLENKTISGLKNKVTATGLTLRSREFMMNDGPRYPIPGDVLSIDDDKLNMVWKPLPPPMTIASAGTGAPLYYKTTGNTHILKTLTGGSGIIVNQQSDGTVSIDFKSGLLNINDFLGTLAIEHGGTGLKTLTKGKVLTVNDTGGIMCEKDYPTSAFVGTMDKQELKNKILTDGTNVIASNIMSFPNGKVILNGSMPMNGEVLTGIVGKNGEHMAEWKPIPKSVNAKNVGNGCEIYMEKQLSDTEVTLVFKTLKSKRPDLLTIDTGNDVDNSGKGTVVFEINEKNLDLNHIGTSILDVSRGGTGTGSFPAGCILVGNGANAISASRVAPKGAFVGTIDQQTLENKIIKDHSNIVTASLLRACGQDLVLDTDTVPEVGQILKVIEPGVVGWRSTSDDNPELQKYQALFKPTIAEVATLKKENEALKLAIIKLNMHITTILEKLGTLELRNTN